MKKSTGMIAALSAIMFAASGAIAGESNLKTAPTEKDTFNGSPELIWNEAFFAGGPRHESERFNPHATRHIIRTLEMEKSSDVAPVKKTEDLKS